jgi:hypothetical protein
MPRVNMGCPLGLSTFNTLPISRRDDHNCDRRVMEVFGRPVQSAITPAQLACVWSLRSFNWVESTRQSSGCSIFAPGIYKVFVNSGTLFLLTEYVEPTQLRDHLGPHGLDSCRRSEAAWHDLVAEGVELLAHMPVPSDAPAGTPVSGH